MFYCGTFQEDKVYLFGVLNAQKGGRIDFLFFERVAEREKVRQ